MCTALTYFDSASRPYLARSLELNLLMPYDLVAVPAGVALSSTVPGKDPVKWTSAHSLVAISAAKSGKPGSQSIEDYSLFDGTNDAGLTTNFNAFSNDYEPPLPDVPSVLEAADLCLWILSQFSKVAEVRSALKSLPVNPTRLPVCGNVPYPMHGMITDAEGQSVVLEFEQDSLKVIDNPVHVMTNNPAFDWHLTNLNNWTQLDNTDKSSSTFGSLDVAQPDSGIAIGGLPSSNTAVDRFVRAAYYSKFAAKVDDPDDALTILSHVINNFDRPRGATVDPPGSSGEGVAFGGDDAPKGVSSEWTTHSFMSDPGRHRYLVRSSNAINWSQFDLGGLSGLEAPQMFPVESLDPMGGDATERFLSPKG